MTMTKLVSLSLFFAALSFAAPPIEKVERVDDITLLKMQAAKAQMEAVREHGRALAAEAELSKIAFDKAVAEHDGLLNEMFAKYKVDPKRGDTVSTDGTINRKVPVPPPAPPAKKK